MTILAFRLLGISEILLSLTTLLLSLSLIALYSLSLSVYIDEISLAIFRFFDKNSRSIYTIHSDFINGISDLTHPISQ